MSNNAVDFLEETQALDDDHALENESVAETHRGLVGFMMNTMGTSRRVTVNLLLLLSAVCFILAGIIFTITYASADVDDTSAESIKQLNESRLYE